MEYLQLPDDYEDDLIASAMYGRELEYFHYKFDLINFKFLIEHMPAVAAPTKLENSQNTIDDNYQEALRAYNISLQKWEYRNNILKRIDETTARMAEVENSYAALQAQITDEDAHQAAIIRTTEKREKEANATRSDK